MSFQKRVERPGIPDRYYIRISSGGVSKCIRGKMASTGMPDELCDTLPNCVGYAWGRWHEILGDLSFKHWVSGNAEDLYEKMDKSFVRSQDPKEGAMMCFRKGKTDNPDDGCGHVLIVEEVIDKDTIVVSDSGYNTDDVFRLTKRTRDNGNWGLNAKYTFQGFVYCPYKENKPIKPVPKPEPKPEPKIIPPSYIVKRGDTLTKIAKDFDSTVAKLAAFNEIKDPNQIFTGQIIYIPDEIIVTADRTTTLWKLQQTYGTPWKIISEYNKLDPDDIHTGMKIAVPIKRK